MNIEKDLTVLKYLIQQTKSKAVIMESKLDSMTSKERDSLIKENPELLKSIHEVWDMLG